MNRIREVREKKGLSGHKIAEQLGISAPYYYDIEKGKRRGNPDLFRRLAEILDVSVDYLLGLEDEPRSLQEKTHDQKYPPEGKEKRTKPIDTREWYNRDEPPSNIELEEFLRQSNVQFNGAPLDEEDKEDIIEFLKFAWKTLKKEKEKEKGK
ncbi:transcriptional regulator [Moorella sp. E308F]|uniref:helix-turn-helix domain-containing protein n=1 Tax=Moorella sp. E308F TaxID=2572682 RepID=UPI0010FFAE91|nr:helix-turn-helix transcriptional regulator [Moorella sp. E308F]GEA16359.1 transcriptional regulator [Moorella sp. E308F]